MDGAAGGYLHLMRGPPRQAFTNLACSPIRFLALSRQDGRFDLLRQLIGIAMRPPSTIGQTFQPALLVAVHNFVAGLARDPEFSAQGSHAFPVLQPNHEAYAFVHNRTFLSRHPHFPPPYQAKKCNPCLRYVLLPMSQVGQTPFQPHKTQTSTARLN